MKLPELKRRFKNRYVIRIAAGVLTIAVAGGSAGVYTVNAAKTSTKAETTQESTDKKDKKDNKDDEEDLKEVLLLRSAKQQTKKSEKKRLFTLLQITPEKQKMSLSVTG